MALGKRIEETLEILRKDQAWLARASGVDARTISATITRDSERSNYAPQFADALGLNLKWLLTGEGPRFAVDPVQRFGAAEPSAQLKYDSAEDHRLRGEVPLISWVQAGQWTEIEDPYRVGDAERWIRCPVAHGARTFAVKVRGESMFNPGGRVSFSPDDIIFVDPDRPADTGSLVVARLENEKEATFKQLVKEGDRSYLRALNPTWPEPYIRVAKEAITCGVVIAKHVEF